MRFDEVSRDKRDFPQGLSFLLNFCRDQVRYYRHKR